MIIKRIFNQTVEFDVIFEGYINSKLDKAVEEINKECYNVVTIAPQKSEVLK